MHRSDTRPEPTYASYLQLDRLLELQSTLSVPEHPDELHFIATHQAMELGFKVMAAEVRRARKALELRSCARAVAVLRRVNAILEAQLAQLATLTHLDPQAFLQFRPFLGTASGFHSVQFRVLEVLSGLRRRNSLNLVSAFNDGALPEPVIAALSEPSLAQVAGAAAEPPGWPAVYADPDSFADLHLVGEQLLEYDRLWMRWRYDHLVLVERVIGTRTRGTGGLLAGYLERRVGERFFPFLWETRDTLARDRA